jgi:hypothetical protein
MLIMIWMHIQRELRQFNASNSHGLTWALSREGGSGGMLSGMLGNGLGGGSGHAEQMAVMIFYVAPLKQ